jgi:hypothetical protein
MPDLYFFLFPGDRRCLLAGEKSKRVLYARHLQVRHGMNLDQELIMDGFDAAGNAGFGLCQKIHGARLKGAENTLAVGPGRKNDHGRGSFFHEPPQKCEPVHVRHFKVERDHIRQQPERLRYRIHAVDSAADDLDARVAC